jgi:hypothetical protein
LYRHHGLSAAHIKHAYEVMDVSSVCTFIIEVFLHNHHANDIVSQLNEYPPEFTQELCIAALQARDNEHPKSEDLLKKYTDGDYFLESSDDKEKGEPEVEDEI